MCRFCRSKLQVMGSTMRCKLRNRFWGALVIVSLFFAATLVSAQPFPSRPLRIVTSEVGSAGDLSARIMAPLMTISLGQPVIVDNRGFAAVEIVARAQPDGYSLAYYGAPLWLAAFLRNNVPYDPVRDFSPISLTISSPLVLVVHPSLPVYSVKELIRLAKANPGKLNSGSGLAGGSPHLAGALFKAMAGVDIVNVAYKGSGQSLTALLGNEVQIAFPAAAALGSHAKSGRLRALAVTTAQPSELLPGLPSIATAGLPGYEAASLYGIFAPAKTPEKIIERLNREVVKTLSEQDVREKLKNAGVEVVASSPQILLSTISAEMNRMGSVIRSAGIRQ